jgi:hypothetical protein
MTGHIYREWRYRQVAIRDPTEDEAPFQELSDQPNIVPGVQGDVDPSPTVRWLDPSGREGQK